MPSDAEIQELDDELDDYYDDERACMSCGGEGWVWCEDQNSAEGCWAADCDGVSHTCGNCRGSGQAKDQWYW